MLFAQFELRKHLIRTSHLTIKGVFSESEVLAQVSQAASHRKSQAMVPVGGEDSASARPFSSVQRQATEWLVATITCHVYSDYRTVG